MTRKFFSSKIKKIPISWLGTKQGNIVPIEKIKTLDGNQVQIGDKLIPIVS